MTYREIPLPQIRPNPNQPRKWFDPTALTELAVSIQANGLLEPIVVRDDPDSDGFIIIAGERRYRAHLEAGLDSIGATVIDITEAEAYVLSVAENLNRADMTIMEEAGAFQQMLDYGRTLDQISAVLGKGREFITYRLDLLRLIPETVKLVEAGHIRPDLAWHISRLNPQNQRSVTNRFARGHFPDQTSASDFARALYSAEHAEGFFDLQEPTFEAREQATKRRAETRKVLDSVERAVGLLDSLNQLDPDELAALLGPEVGVRMRQAERIEKLARKSVLNLRKAKATVEVAALTLNPSIAN